MTKKRKPALKKEIETSKEKQLQKTAEISIPNISLKSSFPIVGIGASAGGLAAFEAFFSGMPTDTDPGMAFVLVQHLAPDHKSILTDLIRRYTRMQVFEVEDGMKVQPNCIYIIPPNRDMALLNGTLQLMEPSVPRGQRLPIDFFFRSLAQDQHEGAIGIVLSGTGSDGTQGVRAIKSEEGMVMAQNPASSEYDGMPRSAIATGLVDYELLPAEMPAQLIKYVAYTFGKSLRTVATEAPKGENALKKIFVLLRNQTSNDFSQYKLNTIKRRINRRMAVHQIETMDIYVEYLQQTTAEVEALFHELLIGVTNFFRDPEAFQALEEQVIPRLFAGKPAGASIRVWVPGCSTGEEAYSIVILLQERMEAMKQNYKVQVFATDVENKAIVTARTGLYPASITANISPERLARFFTAETDGSAYRIHKGIRDMLVFSEQDMIKDPPFSKLDLISCRNLLIYMGEELQKYIIQLFHYALNPRGFLYLGISETVGEFSDLFTTLDSKTKLYQRKEDIHSVRRRAVSGRVLPPITVTTVQKKADAGKILLREMTEQMLLQKLALVGVLVNGYGDILYLYGRTGLYLEPAPGEAGINNILKMAREGLRYELTLALQEAIKSKETVRHPGLRIKTNGDFTTVNLTIHPVEAPKFTEKTAPAKTLEVPLYLVILEQVSPLHPEPAQMSTSLPAEEERSADTDVNAHLAALKKELMAKDEYLQTTNEELESSNEELQSVNEEMQSTNEELETSKEELQSVNEELATINTELQTKVTDLTRINDDMNNLLAGTGIGTVFVDRNLRIMNFTPATTRIINLIRSDVGRPVAHVVSNLIGYDRLLADTQAVLDSLIPKEIEVQTQKGAWYMMRILPYRTQENVIEGAVITFVDITEMKRTREVLRETNELLRLDVVVRDSHDAITVQDLDGRILAWNPGAVRMFGWSEAEALVMNVRDRIPKNHNTNELAVIHRLAQSRVLKPYRTQRIAKDGTVVEVWMTSTALVNEAGQMYAIATTERAEALKIDPIMEVHHEKQG
ncbi:MAG: PAS domain-containing protein [Candidatus Atribacteria bacterium]|nr:PAS domain-containing protein [Candidatus Atribacteria bacterium]